MFCRIDDVENEMRALILVALGLLGFSVSQAVAADRCQFRELEFNTYQAGSPKWDFAPGVQFTFCSGYTFAFQSDGNFVVYDHKNNPLWNTGTANKGATRMVMQGDGNLVIYRDTEPLWNSQSHGNNGAFLRLQDAGNAVIYAGKKGAVWATPTGKAAWTFHAPKEDKQYCDMRVYPHADGSLQAGALFSNGKKWDGDHFVARLTVPTKSGQKGLVVQHAAGVDGSAFCHRCERAVSSATEGAVDLEDLDWDRAEFVCADGNNEWDDKKISEYIFDIASIFLL